MAVEGSVDLGKILFPSFAGIRVLPFFRLPKDKATLSSKEELQFSAFVREKTLQRFLEAFALFQAAADKRPDNLNSGPGARFFKNNFFARRSTDERQWDVGSPLFHIISV